MQCPKCGKENAPESLYCIGCGEKLVPQAETAPAQAATVKTRFSKTTLILAGVIALLLVLSSALFYKLYWGGEDELEGAKEAGKITVTVDGKTIEIEKKVQKETDLSDEYSLDTIYGRVIELGWRKIVVKSLNTDKVYYIYVGRSTRYSPRRQPRVGEKIKVTYHLRRGRLIGDRVSIE